MTWVVAQTEPSRERLVRVLLMRGEFDDWGNLVRPGYETYLPRIRHRRRKLLLFPGYLFVRLVEQRWYPIRWTPHVIAVLRPGPQESPILEAKLTDLRKRERDGFVRLPRAPRLQKGAQVRIVNGSFEGQLALYDGQPSDDRVRVLLELLGRKVAVELPARDLAPVPNHNSLRHSNG